VIGITRPILAGHSSQALELIHSKQLTRATTSKPSGPIVEGAPKVSRLSSISSKEGPPKCVTQSTMDQKMSRGKLAIAALEAGKPKAAVALSVTFALMFCYDHLTSEAPSGDTVK
jgi:hypothetical protein